MNFLSRKINYFILFFVIFILVLNPYAVVGPLAYFLLPLLILPLLDRLRLISYDSFFLLLALVFISSVGVFSSFLHNIGQILHFKVAISIVFYLFFSYAIFLIFKKKGFDFISSCSKIFGYYIPIFISETSVSARLHLRVQFI